MPDTAELPAIHVNKNLFFELTPNDLGIIMEALQNCPYKKVTATIASIEKQVLAQMLPAENAGESFPK